MNTVEIIHSALFLILMVIGLMFLQKAVSNEIDLVSWWSLSALILSIPFFIYWIIQVKKHLNFSFPTNEVLKYLIATLAFIGVFYVTSEKIITYEISIYDFLPKLILQLAICVAVYIGITYLIDNKTKTLFKAIINELKI